MIYQVEEGSWTKFESDVKESVALFFAEVSDDVRVVVGFLQEIDFVCSDRDKVFEKSFDGDRSTLEFTTKNNRSVRSVT